MSNDKHCDPLTADQQKEAMKRLKAYTDPPCGAITPAHCRSMNCRNLGRCIKESPAT